MGPVKMATGDAMLAWKVGMGVTIAIGLVKTVLSFAGDFARRVVPRAALLGSIAGIAILLIAFLPALKVMRDPLVGLPTLTILLVALLGRVRMPWGLPGAFVAVVATGLPSGSMAIRSHGPPERSCWRKLTGSSLIRALPRRLEYLARTPDTTPSPCR